MINDSNCKITKYYSFDSELQNDKDITSNKILIYFTDPLNATILTTLWTVFICIVMFNFEIFGNDFLHIGPSDNITFFSKQINTWSKWSILMIYAIVSQILRTYGENIIHPWIYNTLQNKDVLIENYTYFQSQYISICSTIHCWMDWVININLSMLQIDFFVMSLLMDAIVTWKANKSHWIKKLLTIS